MNLLALETSGQLCSVALWYQNKMYSRQEILQQRHTEYVLPMIEAMLQQTSCALSDLDAIAFGRGPGSFTGLRIAAGVAQGLALAHDLPVVPVSTLEAIALAAHRTTGRTRWSLNAQF